STLRGGYSGLLPDPTGKGALRLTTGTPHYWQTGAIVSNFTFPTDQGIEVTFKTFSYQGETFPFYDSIGVYQGWGNNGADGISFYLMDGSEPPGIGAVGGSLAYSC